MNIETHIDPEVGQAVVDADGNKIGEVVAVYEDEMTGAPEWLCVKSGSLISGDAMLVPLDGARLADGQIEVPYLEDQIDESPRVDGEAQSLDLPTELRLYEHYHVLRILPGDAEARKQRNAEQPATARFRLRRRT